MGKRAVAAKRQINAIVTASHIIVVSAFSVTQYFFLYNTGLIQEPRINSAYYFFAGLTDIFLALILWFILDDNKAQAVFMDEDRAYAIVDVLKAE